MSKKYISTSVKISKKTLGKDCAMKSLWYTDKETKEIIAGAGFIGWTLMNYYKAIAMQEKPNMEDAHMVEQHFGDTVPIKSVTNARLKLTKIGWFLRTKRKGHIIYVIGKSAVDHHKKALK